MVEVQFVEPPSEEPPSTVLPRGSSTPKRKARAKTKAWPNGETMNSEILKEACAGSQIDRRDAQIDGIERSALGVGGIVAAFAGVSDAETRDERGLATGGFHPG